MQRWMINLRCFSGVFSLRIINFDSSLRCKCCLECILSTICVTDLICSHNVIALTNTEVLLDCSRTTITLFSAIVLLSALACDITFLIGCTNLIHELLTVWNSISRSITAIDWFKTAQAHTLSCLSQVISVKSNTLASCWTNVRDSGTLAWLAWCLTNIIPKSVYRTRLTLI